MPHAPIPVNESDRLEALLRYKILDTDAESAYDDLVEIAAHICNTPISLISLVDSDRQWFKAKKGLDADQTERDIAFCAHAIQQDHVFLVEDASQDPRFKDNPLVTGDPDIRFYAGAPLVTHDGYSLGTLCVIDQKPHQLSQEQSKALKALSRQVVSQLELRRYAMELDTLNQRKDQFLALLSHDLRNLFNAILGFSRHLSKSAHRFSQAETIKVAEAINHSANQTYQLLTNLLDWSRIHLNDSKIIFDQVNFNEVTENVINLLATEAKTKSLSLNSTIPESVTARADKQMIYSLIQNLVNNAIKFSPPEETITIESNMSKAELVIEITNTCREIATEKVATLFTRNDFASTVGTAGEAGTGFGTKLCVDIVRQHGGTIGARKQGDKIVVSFHLPIS